MDVREVVRRFIMSSFEQGGRVIIVAPAKYLLFKRFVFWPYTNGETPSQILCDLARFAEQVDLVATWPNTPEELKLIFDIAHCIKPPRSLPLDLYIHLSPPVLLINKNEAYYRFLRRNLEKKELEELMGLADKIIKESKKLDIFIYDDIWREYCRHFRYHDVRCF
jgi:hypothetical protein